MGSAGMLFQQIVKMFLMMAVGYVLSRRKVIDAKITAGLSDLLLMVATPCTLITSFNQDYSSEKLNGLLLSFGLSFAVYLFNILMARVLCRRDDRMGKFCAIFSNAGFIGIPLVSGVFGIESVFYLSPFVVCFYLFVWTVGVVLVSGDRKEAAFRKVAVNPCILAVFIGLAVFLIPAKMPAAVMDAVSMLGGMNSPLAMLILGAYLARTRLADMFRNKKAYLISFYRLVLLPGLLLPAILLLPENCRRIGIIILIGAAAPVGALAPVFAQMYHQDTDEGTQTVCLSTVFCLITMPLILTAAEWLGAR